MDNFYDKKIIEFEERPSKKTLDFFTQLFNQLTGNYYFDLTKWKIRNNLIILDVFKYSQHLTFEIMRNNKVVMRDQAINTSFTLPWLDIYSLCENISDQIESLAPYDFIIKKGKIIQ